MNEHVKLDGLVPARLAPKSRKIVLDDYCVAADIGFHDFEVGAPQRLLVTVEIWLDDLAPPDDDDPSHAWDYDYLRTEVQALAGDSVYHDSSHRHLYLLVGRLAASSWSAGAR